MHTTKTDTKQFSQHLHEEIKAKMAFNFKSIIILIFLLSLCLSPLHAIDHASDLKTYIVHVKAPDPRSTPRSGDLESWYRSFLPTSTKATKDTEKDRLVFSYNSAFKGFAARLSPEEARAMEEKDGFISARPEMKLSLQTTRSPSFLGLHKKEGLWEDSDYGEGVIIALVDTGISPHHPSFNDKGMPPPPRKWKGKCEFNHTSCNNKIIGARNFGLNTKGKSPLDDHGHGTHTASIAAGRFVKGANLLGSARGTASGVAPHAHLAIYKVCDPMCYESVVIAGMDAAIEDGVDVISVSLGGFFGHFYYNDGVAVAAFSSIQRGIVVSCSAGNNGPSKSSLINDAPWLLTVGASTIDRRIRATAVLGNNHTFDGQSAYQPKDFPRKKFPLVYPGLRDPRREICTEESLKNIDVRGKIVVCNFALIEDTEWGEIVKNAGGKGLITLNHDIYANTTFSEASVLPATHVTYADGQKIIAYLKSTTKTKAKATLLFKGTIIGDNRAPVVAAFSSRGPGRVTQGILKPDIVGPGANILAAWPDKKTPFNIMSGTSMSTPHLSGAAALLRRVHPKWSPAAIKSAIMTTSDMTNHARDPIQDETFLPADIFSTGSGHVNPTRAADPGLIYDLGSKDYVAFMCGQDYVRPFIEVIVGHEVNCTKEKRISASQLNYPSFALTFNSSKPQTYSRTVTNVGRAKSSYVVDIVPPAGIEVVVEPTSLKFAKVKQKLRYKVTFRRSETAAKSGFAQGYLNWNSVKHSVRSPIAVLLLDSDKDN